MREAASGLPKAFAPPHLLQLFPGVGEQFFHFIRQCGHVVAADGDAGFQQVVAIALFLAGDGIGDAHRKPACHRLAGGQAARFADKHIGGGHIFVHVAREADGDEPRRPRAFRHPGRPDFRLQVLAFSPRWPRSGAGMGNVVEFLNHAFDGARRQSRRR